MRFSLAIIALVLGLSRLDAQPAGAPEKTVVTVTATVAVTDETASKPGVVTFTRTGDLSAPLAVEINVKGSAKAGIDYQELAKNVTIPAQENSLAVSIVAVGDFEKESARTVVVQLKSDSHYEIGDASSASVTINDAVPELFIATLRPPADAAESTAYGTATLLLSPDRLRAKVTVTHGNLTSPLSSAHLKLGAPNSATEGAFIANFAHDQRVQFDWVLKASGQYTIPSLQQALERGRIYAALDTKNHPTGELRGNFIHATGSEKFQPPPPPGKLANTPLTPRDVARFLTQTTFGPTKTEIDEFINPTPQPNQPPPKPKTFDGWINEQMALPRVPILK